VRGDVEVVSWRAKPRRAASRCYEFVISRRSAPRHIPSATDYAPYRRRAEVVRQIAAAVNYFDARRPTARRLASSVRVLRGRLMSRHDPRRSLDDTVPTTWIALERLGKSQIPLRYPGRRPGRRPVASWSLAYRALSSSLAAS